VYDERLRISPGAERMLAAFKAAGAVTALVSGGFTFFTDRLKSRLGLDFTLANRFEVRDDKLTGRVDGDIVDAQAKARAIRELHARHPGLTVVIGDGANDLPMFAEADVSVAYRAKPCRAREGNAHDRFLRARRGRESVRLDLVDPRHLDRFQDLLAAARVIVVEVGQIDDPVVEVDEAHAAGIDIGMRLRERDRDFGDVGPLDLHRPSFAWLMVYFGISTTSLLSSTIAWHDRRDTGVRPHARSRRSSSSSDDGASESKPSRMMQ
jgi:hypothetical protein